MNRAVYDDDMIPLFILYIDNINKTTRKQEQRLRMQFLYLRKLYELALQYMNTSTWLVCICCAIQELSDNGIISVKNEQIVRRIHSQFRMNNKFIIPNMRIQREPKLLFLYL